MLDHFSSLSLETTEKFPSKLFLSVIEERPPLILLLERSIRALSSQATVTYLHTNHIIINKLIIHIFATSSHSYATQYANIRTY